MATHCKGVIDETITDVLEMKEMVTKGELLFTLAEYALRQFAGLSPAKF